MKRIPPRYLIGETKTNNLTRPNLVSLQCPQCGAFSSLTLNNHKIDTFTQTISSSGICPTCKFRIGFWSITDNKTSSHEVYHHPSSHDFLESISDEKIPDSIYKAYTETVAAFNSQNYVITAASCRRTLEGIFKYQLSEKHATDNLAKLIENSVDKIDFALPIRQLSDAIRKGGNLGAHFDMKAEPDQETSRMMLVLLEYLIIYIYVMPSNIRHLEKKLDQRNSLAER